MSQSEVITALPTGDDADKAVLRNYLIKRTIYPLDDDEDPTAFEALDSETGAIPRGIAWGGIVFWLDPDDTTTAHDGVTTLVTSDGYRYKYDGLDYLIRSVLDKDLTAPPGSEAYGDSYIVGAGATGDWAGSSGKLAIFTSRGWKFILPKVGQIVYVEDEDSYYHYDVNGDWIGGFGDTVISSNIVQPTNILGGRVFWVVENQTTNTPPGAPTTGVQYIIGSSPTGDWSGHASKLAIYTGSSWVIVTPTEGYKAYDKATNFNYTYSGSAWVQDSYGLTLIQTQLLTGAVSSVDFTGLSSSTFDQFLLVIDGLETTANADVLFRFGTGSTTWQATNYAHGNTDGTDGAVSSGFGATGATSIDLNDQLINAAAENSFNAQLIISLKSTTRYPSVHGTAVYRDNNGVVHSARIGGMRETAATYTGFRILPSTGSFDAGRLSLFGYAKA